MNIQSLKLNFYGKNHRRKAGNGSIDSSRKALSYRVIKIFLFFVSDHLNPVCYDILRFNLLRGGVGGAQRLGVLKPISGYTNHNEIWYR